MQEGLCRWWKVRRRGSPSPAQIHAVLQWVETASQRFGRFRSLEDCLEQHQVQLEVSQADHRVAGVRFRARLDLDQRRLTIFAAALDELQDHCPDRALLLRVVLFHEVFHLLCPECPEEAAAHWFAGSQAGLQTFPGLWDLKSE